jgi:hypothetical protein
MSIEHIIIIIIILYFHYKQNEVKW